MSHFGKILGTLEHMPSPCVQEPGWPSGWAPARHRIGARLAAALAVGLLLGGMRDSAPAGFAATSSPGPLSVESERKSFALADPGLIIELVAAEPDVVSPVAMAWDPDGRLFVAEMRDYPKGTGKGAIRMLEDRDGNGLYERSTVFADQLPYPNSVLPWNGGVLVTAAPDIVFLKDLDGDGHADERQVLLTGLGQGNQQLRANGLFWGHDNWIYGANGRSDGELRWSASEIARGAPVSALSLRGRDFRFRPETLQMEVLAGRSQFGHGEDDAGSRFLSWNTIPIRHEVFPESYLARQPSLGAREVLWDVFPADDDKQVFQISPLPRIFNEEPAGFFNASCGLAILRAGGLGAAYRGNAFVCEPLRNLVHRRVLRTDGPTFVAERAEAGVEFLASKDTWFHPVNLATGPDGALYVADFYRQWVEHPDYVHDKSLIDKVDWRTGAEHGRIWRIREARERVKTAPPKLSQANLAGLLSALSHENAWWRLTAQRLLLERRFPGAVPTLQILARQASKHTARMHALWTLEGLDALNLETILEALQDERPAIREQAIRAAEPRLRPTPGNATQEMTSALRAAVVSLTNDVDARVRLRLALALGAWNGADQLQALVALARRDATNSWHALAIASSSGDQTGLLLDGYSKLIPQEVTEQELAFMDLLAALVGAHESTPVILKHLSAAENLPRDAQAAILAGLLDGRRKLSRPGAALPESSGAPTLNLDQAIQKFTLTAVGQATNDAISKTARLRWIRFLGDARPPFVTNTLLSLLKPAHDAGIRLQALGSLLSITNEAISRALVEGWNEWPRNVRRQIVITGSRDRSLAAALVGGLEGSIIQPLEIDPASRQALLNIDDAALRTRAAKWLSNLASTDRESVIKKFQAALVLEPEALRGAALFAARCLPCHKVQDRGSRVGPDLTGVAGHSKETLLSDILDPNRQSNPDYLAYAVTTISGEHYTALMEDETPASVTLRLAGSPDLVIPRAQIKNLKATGKSLMPEGLEQGLSEQDMADLIAFARKPDKSLLPQE